MIGAKAGLRDMIWSAWIVFSVDTMLAMMPVIFASIGFEGAILLTSIEHILLPRTR